MDINNFVIKAYQKVVQNFIKTENLNSKSTKIIFPYLTGNLPEIELFVTKYGDKTFRINNSSYSLGNLNTYEESEILEIIKEMSYIFGFSLGDDLSLYIELNEKDFENLVPSDVSISHIENFIKCIALIKKLLIFFEYKNYYENNKSK